MTRPRKGRTNALDELESLAAAAPNDPDALTQLLHRTTQLRLTLARAALLTVRVDPMISSEDIAQEVALEVVTSVHLYDRTRGRFGGWLTGITRHVAYRRSRPLPRDSNRRQAMASQPYAVALRQTLSSAHLSPLDRRLIHLLALGGTVRDVAQVCGTTRAAAAKRIQRLRGRLEPNLV